MGRRQTAGVAGGSGVGGVNFQNTTITAANDLDITVDPSGTGIFKIAGDAQLQAQGDLRWADADSSNWVAFQAPSTVASNVTWTLPSADGSASQAIVTNGSGVLSFAAAGAALSDNTSDSGTNYLAFTTLSSGFLTTARVATTKLTFQPSTGLLSTTEITVGGTARSLRLENAKTANHTLALVDQDKVVTFTGASNVTVTVPPNSSVAFPIGSVVYIHRYGSGTVTLAAGAGVTLTKVGDLLAYEELYCRKRDTDTWTIVDQGAGSLSATGGTLSTSGLYDVHTFTSSGTFTIS